MIALLTTPESSRFRQVNEKLVVFILGSKAVRTETRFVSCPISASLHVRNHPGRQQHLQQDIFQPPSRAYGIGLLHVSQLMVLGQCVDSHYDHELTCLFKPGVENSTVVPCLAHSINRAETANQTPRCKHTMRLTSSRNKCRSQPLQIPPV